ncbi:MAG: hypothetical protein AcusKO_46330 [Acuticoccus sp.]
MTCLALVVITWGSASAARAVETDRTIIRVGYSDFAPYALTLPNGEAAGFGVEVLRTIAAQEGYALTFVRTSNPGETMQLLRDGDIDITTLLGPTRERSRHGLFTTPVDRLSMSLVAATASGFTDISQLAGKRIGVVAGSTAVAAARKAVADPALVTVRSLPELLVALLSGTVDAVTIPYGPYKALARKADVDERIAAVGPPLRTQEMVFVVASGEGDLLAIVNAGLARLVEGDAMAGIRRHWFGRDKHFLQRSGVRMMLSAGAVAVLALVIGGSVAWHAHRRAHRSFAEVGANRLLIDALNGVDFIVVIYDAKMRAVHWNEATTVHFPGFLERLEAGISFRELVHASYLGNHVAAAQPIRDIESFTGHLEHQLRAKGRTEPRLVRTPGGSIFEATDFRIGKDMFASVRKDVTRLEERADQERQSSLARYEVLFNNAAVGLAQMTFEGDLLKINDRLAAILRCDRDDLPLANVNDYVVEDDRATLNAQVGRLIDGADSEPAEIRMRAHTGEALWARVTLARVVAADPAAPHYLVLCIEDVTARRKVEEQRTILLGELSHRVKNILAVVQTITMQTLRNAGAEEDVRDKVFIRLRAIAAAHDLVFRTSEQDVASVLRSQIGPFQDVGASRVDTAGPSIELPVDLVYALGLIVHELITNAVKYGALSAAEGRVGVVWRREAATMHLCWSETGGPPTEPPARKGFGSQLIRQMVGHARGGSVNFDFRPEGLVVDLVINLED